MNGTMRFISTIIELYELFIGGGAAIFYHLNQNLTLHPRKLTRQKFERKLSIILLS